MQTGNRNRGANAIASPPGAVERLSPAPRPRPLPRRRIALYLFVAIVVLVPAFWNWPAAYPWNHDSPCVTQTAAVQTAQAVGIAEPLVTPTMPGACVELATLVARRDATSFP